MSYFFYPEHINEEGILNPEFSHHLYACRVNKGEEVKITNLKGGFDIIRITDFIKKERLYYYKKLNSFYTSPKKVNKILFQAIIDKDYLEKLVETLPFTIFDHLKLFSSDFSQKQNINLSRLNKILIRSCEQSETVFSPVIEVIDTLPDFDINKSIIFFTQQENSDFKSKAQKDYTNYVVGPEGGWSNEEEKQFLILDKVNLGKQIYPSWLMPMVISFNKI
jgi:RsmE family RNA methyltransferase